MNGFFLRKTRLMRRHGLVLFLKESNRKWPEMATGWRHTMGRKEEILSLLERDAKLTPAEIAVMIGRSEEEVSRLIQQMEASGVILGYRAMINWE
ncbi:MAG: Lrp/AsnC family transcriptional regulator, partial [Clostridia bacterium]|nr:Lrp/AsnC family transcriptional regulator [Clostridia bacterium]